MTNKKRLDKSIKLIWEFIEAIHDVSLFFYDWSVRVLFLILFLFILSKETPDANFGFLINISEYLGFLLPISMVIFVKRKINEK